MIYFDYSWPGPKAGTATEAVRFFLLFYLVIKRLYHLEILFASSILMKQKIII